MNETEANFLVRLRETFRVEAAEHIEAIGRGLLDLDRGTRAERFSAVERVFREAHSLKGAARSVSMPRVEHLCLDLEAVFAAMKLGELSTSPELLDAVQGALRALDAACDSTAERRQGRSDEERRAQLTLRSFLGDINEPATASDVPATMESAHATLAVVPSPVHEVPVDPARAAAPFGGKTIAQTWLSPAATSVAGETVRVSTKKLGTILRESEELVGAELAAQARAGELGQLASEVARWNRSRMREASVWRKVDRGADAVAELFDSELLFMRGLESSLRGVAVRARHDAIGLAADLDRLLDDTRSTLLVPCSYLLGRLAPAVREMAREQGKEARMVVTGEDLEIDRRILDELKDPFIHLLRNCVDHGVEKPDVRRKRGKPERASVAVAARSLEGSRVELSVADDGAGIDIAKAQEVALRLQWVTSAELGTMTEPETLELLFRSGFSTSPIMTDLSGRGLGLAIVRETVERLGGTVDLRSAPGLGTTFRLVVPLSLAAFRGVLVSVADRRFVIPTASVLRVTRVVTNEIRTVENRQVIAVGDRLTSLVRLSDVLELKAPKVGANGAVLPVVVLRAAGRDVAFLVDAVLGEQEVMVKDLGPQLVRVRNVSGASLAGSGVVVPILNASDLVFSAASMGAPELDTAGAAPAVDSPPRLLFAEDSITARTLIKSILEGAGYEVVAAVDGFDAWTRLKTEPFDLVVSDVDMPRIDGFELTARIRADEHLGDLPVVLVTALGSHQDRERGIDVGANAYIVKNDFDQGNLLEIVARLV